MPAFKRIPGNRAAVAIAIEAGKGTAIGVLLALGYKVSQSDPTQSFLDNYYQNSPAAKN
jgi:hypothetical protein